MKTNLMLVLKYLVSLLPVFVFLSIILLAAAGIDVSFIGDFIREAKLIQVNGMVINPFIVEFFVFSPIIISVLVTMSLVKRSTYQL